MGSGRGEEGHRPAYLITIALMIIVFLVMVFFNFLSSGNILPGVFLNATGDISDIYYIEITPAGWTFAIWGFIYTYQVIFIAYILSTICRRSLKGYLYYSPSYLPPIIYIIYMVNNACNIVWLFVWDRQYLEYALIVIALTPVTLYLIIGISMKRLQQYAPDLIEQGNVREPRLVIGIVHNGLGMYAAWVTIATLLNGAMVISYIGGLSQQIASSIALCVLAFEAVLYILVDFIVFEKHFRHLYTPYLVLHVALIGSLQKNYNADSPNSIFTMGLIGIGTLVLLFKIAYSIYMCKTEPLFERHRGDINKVSP